MNDALVNRQRVEILQLREENDRLRAMVQKLTPPDPSSAILAMLLGTRPEMPDTAF